MQIAHEDFRRNRREGFAKAWTVFADYVVRDGLVVPESRKKIARVYGPLAHPELPEALASLRSGDQEKVLEFVREYGLLGFEQLAAGSGSRGIGDPLHWIVAHAKTVYLVMDLLRLIQNGDDDGARAALACLKPTGEMPLPSVQFAAGPVLDDRWFGLGEIRRGPAALALARNIVRKIVNANLQGIVPKLYEGQETLLLFFSYDALIQAVYYQIATTAIGGRIQRCAAVGCSGLFVQHDPRQRFCPPLFDVPDTSPCGNRERARRFRKKKKYAKTITEDRKGGRHAKRKA